MKKLACASLVLALSLSLSTAEAAPCVYDMTPLPVIKGVVADITPTGVQLSDGTAVILPQEFLAHIHLNQKLAVRGLISVATHTVQALALDGNPPICPSTPAIPHGAFPGSPAYDTIHP